jgi:cholesterol transport system auxiliary component
MKMKPLPNKMKTAPARGRRLARMAALLAPLLLAAGCSSLLPASQPAPNLYSLDYEARGGAPAPGSGVIVLVTAPRAAAGFDRTRMVYVKQAHQVEYFAQSQWVESPARMLGPLLVAALEHQGAFRAVMQTPSTAAGQVRLDTEIIRLQQEFLRTPSQVRFTLRARLVSDDTRELIATREFEGVVDAPSENPYGGVRAANQAVSKVLDEVAAFCAEKTGGMSTAPVK